MDPICPQCFGFGAIQNRGSQAPCETCHGRGRVILASPDPQPSLPLDRPSSVPRPDLAMIVDHLSDQVRDLTAAISVQDARLANLERTLGPVTEPVPDIDSPSPADPS